VTAVGAAPTLRIRVVPRARTNLLTREPDGSLRARLTAPPVEGAANRALLELVARALGVKRSALALVQGAHHREKVVAVAGLSAVELGLRVAALAGPDVDKAGRRG
jgi:uncharacterized protein YggU (UPF0235/DUF167 family)